MFKRPFNTVLARLGLVAAVLATLLILAPAASAQSASECAQDGDTLKCTYVENGTDPVTELSATDPDEGEDTIVWSVVEADVDTANFEISDEGVLTFKSAPSFEGPEVERDQRHARRQERIRPGG